MKTKEMEIKKVAERRGCTEEEVMQLNSICWRCVANCPGTKSQVWTGCVERKLK